MPEKTNTLDFWIIVFSASGAAILLIVVGLSCLVWVMKVRNKPDDEVPIIPPADAPRNEGMDGGNKFCRILKYNSGGLALFGDFSLDYGRTSWS